MTIMQTERNGRNGKGAPTPRITPEHHAPRRTRPRDEPERLDPPIPPDPDPAAGRWTRRYRQLRRVLLLVDLLAPLRFGASIPALARDYREFSGDPVCERTIRRDLAALLEIGMVEESKPGVFRWSDRQAVAKAIRTEAEKRAARLWDDKEVAV